MKAKLTLTFEDGSVKEIELEKAIEIDVSPDRRQSITFQQQAIGKWVMSFTKPLFEGKKIKTIGMEKTP